MKKFLFLLSVVFISLCTSCTENTYENSDEYWESISSQKAYEDAGLHSLAEQEKSIRRQKLKSSKQDDSEPTFGLVIFFMVICGGIIIYAVREMSKQNRLEVERNMRKTPEYIEKQKMLIQEEERQRRKVLDDAKALVIAEYGEITKEIILRYSNNLDDRILIFSEKSVIRIYNKAYKFSDILGYTVTDNKSTIIEGGNSSSITTTSTGSLVGRAVVGGVLLGGVGAIAGATSAKKNIETISGNQIVSETHNYTIHINVNDLSSPIVSINTKSSEERTQEIIGVLNILINKNNTKNE